MNTHIAMLNRIQWYSSMINVTLYHNDNQITGIRIADNQLFVPGYSSDDGDSIEIRNLPIIDKDQMELIIKSSDSCETLTRKSFETINTLKSSFKDKTFESFSIGIIAGVVHIISLDCVVERYFKSEINVPDKWLLYCIDQPIGTRTVESL
jgi:hypothetical protein